LYVEQGLFTEAEISARRVLDLDPENVDALRSLVRALDEEGEVVDFGTLAPDEPEAVAEDEVADFGALAPDEPEAVAEEEVADFGALAPDEPEAVAEEEVADFGALARDELEAVVEEEVADFGALTPDEPAEEIRTRTMADLYVTQGLIDRAIEVYEHLADTDPDDAELRERLEQLRSGDQGTEGASGDGAQPAESPAVEQVLEADEGDDVEVETLARDLAGSGDEEHDVDTPFAWAEEESEQPADVEEASSIRSFFDDLLSYEPASEPEES
jgi:tetratricopeptide (TPR) repeat protein